MDYTKILEELRILFQRWKENNTVPQVEKDIALNRISELYSAVLNDEMVGGGGTSCVKANVQEIGDLYIADDGVMEAPESEPESATAQEPAPATAQESQPTTEKLTEKSVEYNQKIEAELSETDARFAEELFGGDKDIYISEVKKMLAMGELDDILIYISETYSWNPDNSVAEEFVGKFVKRFS